MKHPMNPRTLLYLGLIAMVAGALASCGGSGKVQARDPGDNSSTEVSVAVAKAARKTLEQTPTVSSELVPFQEIDVYAKESGYVKELNVDYGTHVKAGQVMAVLEIPELQLQLQAGRRRDQSCRRSGYACRHASRRRGGAQQSSAFHYDSLGRGRQDESRIGGAAGSGRCAGKGSGRGRRMWKRQKSNLQIRAEPGWKPLSAKRQRDGALFDYAKITAPFDGVVTQRFANLGTLMQAGTNSSTQAMPLVQLSEDDLFRLVIPVPESYVRYIHVGDPVSVNVPSLNRTFPGKVARFSADVKEDTRTMHTEVDVYNTPDRSLVRVCTRTPRFSFRRRPARCPCRSGDQPRRRPRNSRRGNPIQPD